MIALLLGPGEDNLDLPRPATQESLIAKKTTGRILLGILLGVFHRLYF